MLKRRSTLDHAERLRRNKCIELCSILERCLQISTEDRLLLRKLLKGDDADLSALFDKYKQDKLLPQLQVALRKYAAARKKDAYYHIAGQSKERNRKLNTEDSHPGSLQSSYRQSPVKPAQAEGLLFHAVSQRESHSLLSRRTVQQNSLLHSKNLSKQRLSTVNLDHQPNHQSNSKHHLLPQQASTLQHPQVSHRNQVLTSRQSLKSGDRCKNLSIDFGNNSTNNQNGIKAMQKEQQKMQNSSSSLLKIGRGERENLGDRSTRQDQSSTICRSVSPNHPMKSQLSSRGKEALTPQCYSSQIRELLKSKNNDIKRKINLDQDMSNCGHTSAQCDTIASNLHNQNKLQSTAKFQQNTEAIQLCERGIHNCKQDYLTPSMQNDNALQNCMTKRQTVSYQINGQSSRSNANSQSAKLYDNKIKPKTILRSMDLTKKKLQYNEQDNCLNCPQKEQATNLDENDALTLRMKTMSAYEAQRGSEQEITRSQNQCVTETGVSYKVRIKSQEQNAYSSQQRVNQVHSSLGNYSLQTQKKATFECNSSEQIHPALTSSSFIQSATFNPQSMESYLKYTAPIKQDHTIRNNVQNIVNFHMEPLNCDQIKNTPSNSWNNNQANEITQNKQEQKLALLDLNSALLNLCEGKDTKYERQQQCPQKEHNRQMTPINGASRILSKVTSMEYCQMDQYNPNGQFQFENSCQSDYSSCLSLHPYENDQSQYLCQSRQKGWQRTKKNSFHLSKDPAQQAAMNMAINNENRGRNCQLISSSLHRPTVSLYQGNSCMGIRTSSVPSAIMIGEFSKRIKMVIEGHYDGIEMNSYSGSSLY